MIGLELSSVRNLDAILERARQADRAISSLYVVEQTLLMASTLIIVAHCDAVRRGIQAINRAERDVQKGDDASGNK